MDHLGELRDRLIASVVALTLGVCIAFFFSLPVMDWLKALAPQGVRFIQLTPGEVFLASFRIAVFLGGVLASPVILFHVLRFVLPGLTVREQRFLLWIVGGGGLLFVAGMAFAYYAVLPSTLTWLLDYGREVAESQMSIARFVEFCTGMILVIGVLFELPILLFMLSFTGLVSSAKLIRHWRMATLWMFLVAAVITPSQDPFTMLVVAVALMALYGLSVLSIRLCNR
jgi:sec-independent protein translocase protein TatC